MRKILLALILAGAGLHVSTADKQEDSNVKYKGPVVYTNLPPPVLYFPNFPERPKFSNRGSEGDNEDKRIEYVPFPYKDLPLLVYQSQNQPPVHVVEKNQNSMKDDSSQHNSGYQTGPAIYRVADNNQYGNHDSDSSHNPQSIIATPSEKYINVGLSTSSIPSTEAQNQQFISIGLTSIQSQGNDLHGQSQSSSHVPQTNNAYNQMQYSANQNGESSEYSPENAEPSDQTGPAYVYYPNSNQNSYSNQYSNQNPELQAQVPVEQITQAIQSYFLQQAQSEQQQTSYPTSQDSQSSGESPPTQHVGITIIRQPAAPDTSEHGENEPQYSPPASAPPNVRHPPVQSNQGYDNNQQQFVSIGVYPINVPGNDYTDPQQYYNVIPPASNDQYQNTNDDYGHSNQNYEPPPPPPPPPTTQNENTQTAGYQVISIDLSALKNQNSGQQQNTAQEYSQPIQRPPPPPPPPQPPQSYRPASENENSYGTTEKEFQQILIQIPNNILSDQAEKPQRGRGTYETPYTGTAQIANVIREPNKVPSRPVGNSRPNYIRQIQQRPPPAMQYKERPRNPPPHSGIISSGINIAIIKQTDSTNNSPVYKNFDQMPPLHHPPVRPPRYAAPNRVPPAPSFSHAPQRPMFGYPNRPASSASTRYNTVREVPESTRYNTVREVPESTRYNTVREVPENTRYNTVREVPNYGGHHYSVSETRYHSQRPFAQYKSRQPTPQHGRIPSIYSSSNHHYTAVNPTVMRPTYYENVHPPIPSVEASATKTQAQFVPSPEIQPAASSVSSSESVEQVLTNNIGEISFDEINAFLNPSYDLFGSLTNGPDKKKVEEETKLLQKVTSDLLNHDLNAASLNPPMPSYPIVKPPPQILNAPFPYKFWEQPMFPTGHVIPPRQIIPPGHMMPPGPMMPPGHMLPPGHMVPRGVAPGNDRMKMMHYYSHMQYPYAGNRPFNPLRKGKERKRGLGKGRLRKKLASLRTSIRHKSKIAPRQEEVDEGSETSSDQFVDSSMYEIAAPRSTIIKRDGPGLDGITIPLRPEHMLLSRVSMDGNEKDDDYEEEDEVALPPIIVYKGTKPPIEIYGSKSDIEGVSTNNETQKSAKDEHENEKESSKSVTTEPPKDLTAQESLQFFSSQGGSYIDYMYSMLPDLIRDSFHRRLDGTSEKWLPVSSLPYVVAEDSYDRNKTTAQKPLSPSKLGSVKESTLPQNSSSSVQPSVEENLEELFSLLGKEETSDLVKE